MPLMLVRRVLLRQAVARRAWARTAACCAGEEEAALDYSPPCPGTVPHHDHHVLLSLPGMGDEAQLGASWPSLVERWVWPGKGGKQLFMNPALGLDRAWHARPRATTQPP